MTKSSNAFGFTGFGFRTREGRENGEELGGCSKGQSAGADRKAVAHVLTVLTPGHLESFTHLSNV